MLRLTVVTIFGLNIFFFMLETNLLAQIPILHDKAIFTSILTGISIVATIGIFIKPGLVGIVCGASLALTFVGDISFTIFKWDTIIHPWWEMMTAEKNQYALVTCQLVYLFVRWWNSIETKND